MATTHVYHWKHGWIPLDHTATKTSGIHSRRDVAKAALGLPQVPAHGREAARNQVIAAAGKHNSTDLLLASWSRHPTVSADDAAAFGGGSAEAHLVKGPHGYHFTPGRAALHDKIVNDLLDGHAAQQSPTFNVMGGGPAAGKSTMISSVADAIPDAATLNADDIKAMLPEYEQRGDDRAAFTHEESSYLVRRATTEAMVRRLNITLDGTGDSSAASMRKKISTARAAGYGVHGYYITIPTDEAVARAQKRAARTGRAVPDTVIIDTHAAVSKVFPEIINDFDTARLFDNTTSLTPVLTRTGGTTVVHDSHLWDEFLAKARGSEPQPAHRTP